MARDPWAVMDGSNRKVDAEDARVSIGTLLTPGTSQVNVRAGLRPGPGNPGKVTQTGTPSINVLVNAFQLVLNSTRGPGPYLETEPTQLTTPILDVPADPTNQRNDLIIFRQADTYYGDGSTVQGTIRVQGTPSGTPQDPDLSAYPDHVKLARVRVPANQTTITDALIDDLRPPWVVALGGVLPITNATDRGTLTPYDGMPIYRLDRDWVEIYDGAAWRVQGIAICTSTADRDSAITSPYDGQLAYTSDTGKIYQRHGGVWREAPAAPLAQLRQTVTQPLADQQFTDITFTGEDHDTHAEHSTSTNTARYTAGFAGKREFAGGVAFAANATGARVLQWAKNGAAIAASDVAYPSAGSGLSTRIAARTIQVDMAAGDYVTLQAFQSSGDELYTFSSGAAASSMTVKYVGN